MLTFSRPSFRSGVMIVRVTVDAAEHEFSLTPADKGTTKAYDSEAVEAALLVKYPAFFTAPPPPP